MLQEEDRTTQHACARNASLRAHSISCVRSPACSYKSLVSMAKKGVKKDIKEEPSKNIPFNPHLQYKQAKAAKAAQEDTRFNRAAYDPRFKDDDEQSSAINLQDDRFNKIFDDTAFNDECMFLPFLSLCSSPLQHYIIPFLPRTHHQYQP